MNKEEIISFLEERSEKIAKQEPDAFNTLAAYQYVINDLLSED